MSDKQTHTPEPWKTGREDTQSYYGHTGQPFSSIYRKDDDERMPMISNGLGGMSRVPLRIAYVEGEDIPREEEKANARRIVACVNACAGMADPAGEIAELRRRLAALSAWSCSQCGARFEETVKPVQLEGVTRCSACATIDCLRHSHDTKLAELRKAKEDAEEAVRLLVLANEQRYQVSLRGPGGRRDHASRRLAETMFKAREIPIVQTMMAQVEAEMNKEPKQ